MPTAFPGANDTFVSPSSPETTPLGSAGSGNYNHAESHQNMGDSIEAMQEEFTLKAHDHSGVAGPGGRKTNKLKQANTHEEPDTDAGPTSIHHTLGTGANQAARGNHTHTQADISGLAHYVCTSTTRPAQPTHGMQIFETDTNQIRVWTKWRGESTFRWVLLPAGEVPTLRLLQGTAQRIYNTGSLIEWRVEEEDNFGMFDQSVSLTEVIVREAGLYDLDASVAWNPDNIFGDRAQIRLMLNGQPTTRQHFEFVRGNLFTPGFVQTVDLSGKIRFAKNDRLTLLASHNGFLSQFTYSSSSQKMDTRLDMIYSTA